MTTENCCFYLQNRLILNKYKQITILNDASRVVSEWCHNLESQSRVVVIVIVEVS